MSESVLALYFYVAVGSEMEHKEYFCHMLPARTRYLATAAVQGNLGNVVPG